MNIGVLASHSGTVLQVVIDGCAQGRLAGRVGIVISNNSRSGALLRAERAGIPGLHLSSTTHPDPRSLDEAMRTALDEASVDLVLLAGFLKKIGPMTLSKYERRILNTHPALLPKYGGPGMYGMNVHEAVIAAGERESGVSIHLVDPEYDTGPVIAQCHVAVMDGDCAETLRERVMARERELVVETLQEIATGRLQLEKRHR